MLGLESPPALLAGHQPQLGTQHSVSMEWLLPAGILAAAGSVSMAVPLVLKGSCPEQLRELFLAAVLSQCRCLHAQRGWWHILLCAQGLCARAKRGANIPSLVKTPPAWCKHPQPGENQGANTPNLSAELRHSHTHSLLAPDFPGVLRQVFFGDVDKVGFCP